MSSVQTRRVTSWENASEKFLTAARVRSGVVTKSGVTHGADRRAGERRLRDIAPRTAPRAQTAATNGRVASAWIETGVVVSPGALSPRGQQG